MKYYRVKKEYDNKPLYHFDSRKHCWKYDGIIIGNELYTEKEYDVLMLRSNLHESYFDYVEISKRKTFWCFGARFESEV